jgi:hypothetical protein
VNDRQYEIQKSFKDKNNTKRTKNFNLSFITTNNGMSKRSCMHLKDLSITKTIYVWKREEVTVCLTINLFEHSLIITKAIKRQFAFLQAKAVQLNLNCGSAAACE